MYDISGHVPVNNKITKAVLRERLLEMLQSLNAEVYLSAEDGAVEFKPAPRNRGKHPLKNITSGRLQLTASEAHQAYIGQIVFRLSLVQMRISLVTISLVIWGYGLLRGYHLLIPLAFTLLTWLFGYAITWLGIRSRFRSFLQSADY